MMKVLKVVAFSISIVFACVILAGVYRFNLADDDIYIEMSDGTVLPYDEAVILENKAKSEEKSAALREGIFTADTPESSLVMRKLFSLQTTTPFNIMLPDSNSLVALTYFLDGDKHKNQDNSELAAGSYQHGEVRGSVLLDYYKITPLNFPEGSSATSATHSDNDKALFTFVAPFAVTTQGSGVFWYLGLFNIDYQTNRLSHLDSEFVGDRVKIKHIEPSEPFDSSNSITVTYNERAPLQAMSDKPSMRKMVELRVSKGEIINLSAISG
ncbi:hypothetical protein [Shewanella woodyi]|uniref:hypothetical protein n=1 Tax=Shewanella woodyi TaxID=60961 RepID=UPI003748FEFD